MNNLNQYKESLLKQIEDLKRPNTKKFDSWLSNNHRKIQSRQRRKIIILENLKNIIKSKNKRKMLNFNNSRNHKKKEHIKKINNKKKKKIIISNTSQGINFQSEKIKIKSKLNQSKLQEEVLEK